MAPRVLLAAFFAVLAGGAPSLDGIPDARAVPSLYEFQSVLLSDAQSLFDGLSVSAAVLGSGSVDPAYVPIMEGELGVARFASAPGGAFEAWIQGFLDELAASALDLASSD